MNQSADQYDQQERDKFTKWVKRNWDKSTRADIASCGCQSGFAKITYTKDNLSHYTRHHDGIWAVLRTEADAYGSDSVIDFMGEWNPETKGQIDDDTSLKERLLWAAIEMVCHDEEADNRAVQR